MNEKREFNKKLIALVLPIIFQNFMSAAVSASDALMLGSVSQDALAAVSLATQVQFIFSLFTATISIGTTILVAQYWGARNRKAVEKVLGIALKLSILIAMVFFVIALFIPAGVMRIFTSDYNMISKGSEYLRLVSVSYLFMGVSQIYLCIMKNCGRVTKSTIISSTTMVIDVILNAILIFGLLGFPKMGIAGAAITTVISRAIELIWTVYESMKKDSVKIRKKYVMHLDKGLYADFLRYAGPVLGNELVWGCGFAMYSVIMGHLGSDAVAANAIAGIVKNLIACVCFGIASGAGILVGNAIGKGNMTMAKEYGDRLCHIAAVVGIVSGGCLFVISPFVVNITNLSAQAQEYLKMMMFISSFYMVGKALNVTTIAGIFCAGGDSKFGFICDAIVMWGITVPLGLVAAFYLRLPVIWVYLIINMDEIIKLPAVYKRYKKYKWLKDVKREEIKI